MIVKCFACGAAIEADDVDGVAEAFVAHGQECHAAVVPRKGDPHLRAQYTEATQRLTGGTERLNESGR